MGFLPAPASYDDLKQHCVSNLPADVVVYQEFHALIVEHAKRMKPSRAEDGRKPVVIRGLT